MSLNPPLRKVAAMLRQLQKNYKFTEEINRYIQENQSAFKRTGRVTNRRVLICQTFGYGIIEYYAQLSNQQARSQSASIDHYCFESQHIYRNGIGLKYPNPILRKVYHSFGSTLKLKWNLIQPDSLSLVYQSWRTFRCIDSKEDLLQLKIENVPVGSLVYDTFLRRLSRASVDVNSLFLFWIILQAHFITKRTLRYFLKHEVLSVFPGDVAYIYSGIVSRIAVINRIPTYTFISAPRMLNRMGPEFCRYKEHWKYPIQFASLPIEEQDAGLLEADRLLSARLAGLHDERMPYMEKSAFAREDHSKYILRKTTKPKILILLHDFFDSPHIYRDMLFPDFWEWICFTLNKASITPFEWYVKTHPNSGKDSGQLIGQLRQQFPGAIFIGSNTSNRQLIQEGIASVFSVYGSAGHEFPYLGVPTVMAGDNPHAAYEFAQTAKTISEYENFIKHADAIETKGSLDEIREFYYMHYLYSELVLPLWPGNPVPDEYIRETEIEHLTKVQQRYHFQNTDSTLTFLLSQRTDKQREDLERYCYHFFGENGI